MSKRQIRSMTDAEFVELLREVGADDPGVTIYEFCRAVGCSFSVIYRRFGSWPAMRELAGLAGRGRRGARREYSAKDVRGAFRRVVAEVGPGVTKAVFTERSGISDDVVKRLFGGWIRLRAAEGLEPNKRGGTGVTAEELRGAFRRVVAEEGPGVTLARFTEVTGYGESVVRRCCGNWRTLRESEGLARREKSPPSPVISDAELMAEYARVKTFLGRRPTLRELGHLSFYGQETFRKRFELFNWRRRIQAILRRRAAARVAEKETSS